VKENWEGFRYEFTDFAENWKKMAGSYIARFKKVIL
jgi:hypothetical protein